MNPVVVLALMLLLMAFFSGMEIAFVAANKLRVEVERSRSGMRGSLTSWLLARMEPVIATTLVGMNICLVIFGFRFAELVEPWLERHISGEGWILLIQTIAATALTLFTAEFLPKTIFRINPNRMLQLFVVPFAFFFIVLYPVTWFTVNLSDFLLRRILHSPGSKQVRQMVFSKVDLSNLVMENLRDGHTEEGDEEDLKLVHNALQFSSVRIRDCMIPRTEVVAVPVSTAIGELRQTFIASGYSRLPVYERDIDGIVGYVHTSSLFSDPGTMDGIIRKIRTVSESMPANRFLTRMLRDRENIAVVIDEYGGTSGIVTTEDILEEIFGEIEDEHDTPTLTEKVTGEGEYLFSGRLEIDYLNETYGLSLPTDESYETLAGLILHHHPSFPRINETIRIPGFSFRITGSSRKKISLIVVTRDA